MLQITLRSVVLVFAAFLQLTAVGCKSGAQMTKEGLKKFPDAQKFDRLFTKNHHSVGLYNGPGGSRVWMSKGLVYDRYIVEMSFDVKKGVTGKLSKIEDVMVVIHEHFYTADGPSSDRWRIHNPGTKLSEDQWRSANSIEDIFRLSGIEPIKDQPISELLELSPEHW